MDDFECEPQVFVPAIDDMEFRLSGRAPPAYKYWFDFHSDLLAMGVDQDTYVNVYHIPTLQQMWKAADTMTQVKKHSDLMTRREALQKVEVRLSTAIHKRRQHVKTLDARIEHTNRLMRSITQKYNLHYDDRCKYMLLSRKKAEREYHRIRHTSWLERALMRRHCKNMRLSIVEGMLRHMMCRASSSSSD